MGPPCEPRGFTIRVTGTATVSFPAEPSRPVFREMVRMGGSNMRSILGLLEHQYRTSPTGVAAVVSARWDMPYFSTLPGVYHAQWCCWCCAAPLAGVTTVRKVWLGNDTETIATRLAFNQVSRTARLEPS